MARRKIVFGVGAGMVSTAVDGLVGLFNIHYYSICLPETASGFWMLLVTIGGFLILAQSSIVPVISRFTAQQCGPIESRAAGLANVRRLAQQALALLLVASLLSYLGYILPVGRKYHLGLTALTSWLLYTAGLACGLDASARFAVLNGLGEVGWDKVTRIGTSAAGGVLTWLSLRSDFGLLGLGVIYLIQGIVTLGLADHLLRKYRKRPSSHFPEAISSRSSASELHPQSTTGESQSQRRQLLVETGKILGLALFGYLVMNFGTLIIERHLGLEIVYKYASLLRVGMLLTSVASLIPQMLYPFVARAWTLGQFRSHRRYFLGGTALAIGTYLLGAVVVWFSAPLLSPIWLGPGKYLGANILGWILLSCGLLVVNVAISTPVLASIGNAFFGVSILNVTLVLPLVWLFTGWWGISGAPIGMLVGTLIPTLWMVSRSWQLMLHHGRREGPEVLAPQPHLLGQ